MPGSYTSFLKRLSLLCLASCVFCFLSHFTSTFLTHSLLITYIGSIFHANLMLWFFATWLIVDGSLKSIWAGSCWLYLWWWRYKGSIICQFKHSKSYPQFLVLFAYLYSIIIQMVDVCPGHGSSGRGLGLRCKGSRFNSMCACMLMHIIFNWMKKYLVLIFHAYHIRKSSAIP